MSKQLSLPARIIIEKVIQSVYIRKGLKLQPSLFLLDFLEVFLLDFIVLTIKQMAVTIARKASERSFVEQCTIFWRIIQEKMEIPEQRERIYLDGLKDIGKGKYITSLKNAAGKSIIEVKWVKLSGEPNFITQVVRKNGGIDRNYYHKNRRQCKQIANNNHGKSTAHPYGKHGEHGEHAHDYIYSDRENLLERPIRELTDAECKENGDIL